MVVNGVYVVSNQAGTPGSVTKSRFEPNFSVPVPLPQPPLPSAGAAVFKDEDCLPPPHGTGAPLPGDAAGNLLQRMGKLDRQDPHKAWPFVPGLCTRPSRIISLLCDSVEAALYTLSRVCTSRAACVPLYPAACIRSLQVPKGQRESDPGRVWLICHHRL